MILQADATQLPFADKSVDLVLASPPYADARTYGIGAQRDCQEWVDWMLVVTAEAVRVSRGLVIWVCAGVTRDWNYWPGPEGLLYEWWKAGGRAWRPCYWHRVGIPGSGGKQWVRADVEYALCFTSCRTAIPWADNTANGHPPKWAPGGEMAYRNSEGTRRNQWGGSHAVDGRSVDEGDVSANNKGLRPSHLLTSNAEAKRGNAPDPSRRANGEMKKVARDGVRKTTRSCTRGKKSGDTINETLYLPPALANPGNLIKGIKVGGGLMGHKLAHENEAPYPQKLAEWFVRGWCPPGGTVLDCFGGSGTTLAAAIKLGRNGINSDIRQSQCELAARRTRDVQPESLF